MKQRTVFIIGLGLLVLSSGVLLWRLIVERLRTQRIIALVDERSNRGVDFVVYRAYKDASSEIKSGTLYFSSRDGWERSFQIGSLKVVAESGPPPAKYAPPAPPTTQTTGTDWYEVYNWHKSRAALRQLQQSAAPSASSELLDGLERVRILAHAERLGVESTNILDPY